MEDINKLKEELWNVEIEILQVIHQICIENDLKYTLAYGTLLGAIRHNGFIPWDDDIDIMMPRADYNKLLRIWNRVAPEGFILQDYNTEADYTNNFAKVRKKHTTFLQLEIEKNKKYHKGIFVDIFPGDIVPLKKIPRVFHYCFSAVNLLYARGYTSGTKGIIGIVEKALLATNKKNYRIRRNNAEKIMGRWNHIDNGQYVFCNTIRDCKLYYPSALFDDCVLAKFEENDYYITKIYDEVLRIKYGDYMKLPPEEDRVWRHHPIVLNFEHDYEEL